MQKATTTAAGLTDSLIFRPLEIEHLSAVRHLNRYLARTFTHYVALPGQAAAIEAHFCSPSHCATLLGENGLGAWLDGHLVGYAAWDPMDGRDQTLRVRAICVDPLFSGCGLGTRILTEIERIGHAKGYRRFSARALPHLTGFFETMDYVVSAKGTLSPGNVGTIPVVFLRKSLPKAAPRKAPRASSDLGVALP